VVVSEWVVVGFVEGWMDDVEKRMSGRGK